VSVDTVPVIHLFSPHSTVFSLFLDLVISLLPFLFEFIHYLPSRLLIYSIGTADIAAAFRSLTTVVAPAQYPVSAVIEYTVRDVTR
jgi:hypothetical protein